MVHLSEQTYVQKHLDKATKHLARTSSSGVYTQIKFSWTEIHLRHLSYNIENSLQSRRIQTQGNQTME